MRHRIVAKLPAHGNANAVAANSARPARIVRLRPILSARNPRPSPAPAMPSIEPYCRPPAVVMLRWNSAITWGMISPTESVVIANMKNIR